MALAVCAVPIAQNAHAQDLIGDDEVWLVDGVSGSDSNDGQGDWSDAFLTIDTARSFAQPGHRIWVRATTYTLSSASDTFLLKDGVWLLGGFAGTETSRTQADPYANPTILDGDNIAYHVVTAPQGTTPATVLDGFVITGGNAVGTSGLQNKGGGLLIDASAQNSVSSPTIVRCRFVDNEAEFGGAVAIQRFQSAGTISSARFINCEFSSNTANDDGGAIWSSRAGFLVLNSLFESNAASGNGGAIATVFLGSLTTPYPVTRLINCTISDNTAVGIVGGVLVERACELDADNCIFWNNEDSNGTTESSQIAIAATPANIAVDYSCVQNLTSTWGTGNFSTTPDLDANFELNPGSMAINAADPDVANDNDNGYFPRDEFDLDKNGISATTSPYQITPDLLVSARVKKARLDMGAYEFESCPGDCVTSATLLPPPDGIVDGADLAVMIGAWSPGPCDFSCCMDIVDDTTLQPPPDGVVTGADLAVLIGAWGNPCMNQGSGDSLLDRGGDPNPIQDETLGPLLEELIETSDAELAETIAALLAEWLAE